MDPTVNELESNKEDNKAAIDSVVGSISEIIKCSTNEVFRRKCFCLMKVGSRQEFERALRTKLTEINENKCTVSVTEFPKPKSHIDRGSTSKPTDDDEFENAEDLEHF